MTKKMTMNEYQLITRETSGNDNLEVLTLGLIGESVEASECYDIILDVHNRASTLTKRTNFLKEIGDVLWYAARLFDVLGQEFENAHDTKHKTQNVSCLTLPIKASQISEHVKKYLGHGHDLDKDFMINSIKSLVTIVDDMARSCGYTLTEAMTTNVEKLRKRYPSGFEVEKSKNRIQDK